MGRCIIVSAQSHRRAHSPSATHSRNGFKLPTERSIKSHGHPMTSSKPSSMLQTPHRSSHSLLKPLSLAMSLTLCFAAFATAHPAAAQTVPALQARITAPIDNSARATLAGSHSPRARSANDAGAVSASMQLKGMSLVFSRTAAQQTALDTLVAAQQSPASPLYHHWLTPDQYAAQFGVAPADIAAAEAWLEQQGFSVDSVARSRNRITFSGTAAQVAAAFGAPLHNYATPASGNQPAATHFAPSADLTIPAALASSVLTIDNLSDFRPRAHFKLHPPQAQAQPRFSSGQTGDNFLTPADVDIIYGVSGATGAGYIGTGQTIAIVGQSAVENSDLTNFQNAAGIPNKLPTFTLVPDTGTSAINPGGSTDSDEVESDIDLEYSNAIAQGATIDFVYTGNSNNNGGAFEAIQYAVDNQIGDIISSSFGTCEPALGSADYSSLNAVLEQAAAQGQTVIAAAGDDGSTDCNGEGTGSDAAAEDEQLAVDFPGSSQYVTSMGGTEFPIADIAPGSPYFNAETGGTDIIASAKSYIPEQVWNDDAGNVSLKETTPSPISSGGGGVSIFTPIPSWQTGVPGIPSSSNRLVPDLALYASPSEPDVTANTFYGGYLFCTSDSSFTGVTGSCADGFRNSAGDLAVAGGTSFDAPIFSGMLAIINQARGFSSTNGQGTINPMLYTLASNPTTYASAFHDVDSGGNQCLAGVTFCGTGPQTTDYAATAGYDEASGLGSVDLFNLLTAWTAGTSTIGNGASAFTLSATNVTVAAGSSTTGTLTLTPVNGFTGTVNLTVNYAALTAGCVMLSPASVSLTGTTAVMATYTVDTTAAACGTTGAVKPGSTTTSSLNPSTAPHLPKSPWQRLPLPATLAGTLLLACFRRRSRLLRSSLLRSSLLRAGMALGLLLTLSFSGLGLTGCGGSAATSKTTTTTTTPPATTFAPTTTPAGTYSVTLIGTNSATPGSTNSTTFTVTVN
jgi:subtilase family serine protease